MTSPSLEVPEPSSKEGESSEADGDPKPPVPLRQRRLPASFWQEPTAPPRPVQPPLPWGFPQRLPPAPLWVRGYCNCAMCLNYAYLLPRFPDVYCGRPPYCGAHCAEQGCKLCPAGWHPERLRRIRAARYNAILD